MTKRPSAQLHMFPVVHQSARQGKTSAKVWAAVLILRRAGKRVYACGHQHKVDDWLVDDAGLLRLARPFLAADSQDVDATSI